MFNVCQKCGEYHADKLIDVSGPYAVCPACGHPHPFGMLPLFCVTGPSGCGKTAVCSQLVQKTQEVVVLESDILWREEFDSPETDWREYRNLWLRVCKNVGQAGRPVVLCGSVNPGQFEAGVESRYFSAIHYLALVCDAETLASRLQNRPTWRGSGTEDFIRTHQDWARWFRETKHEQDVTLLDTSTITVERAADLAFRWVKDKQSGEGDT